jgi:hypothetical protein
VTTDLFEQHRQLIALVEELIVLVGQEPQASIEDIALLRARLGMLGIAHLHAEDELIMHPLLASGRVDELPEAAAIIAEIRISRRYFSDHASRWTMEAVHADRDGYAHALDEMIGVIRAITAREEAGLYGPVLALLKIESARQVH